MYEKTITTKDLQKICKVLSLTTIMVYLENYRFGRFRLTPNCKSNALYRLNTGFLNTFYTYLFYRGKIEAATNIKKEFKDFEVKAIEMD